MSITFPTQRRVWIPAMAAGAMAVVVATAALSTRTEAPGRSAPEGVAEGPGTVRQAEWDVDVEIDGVIGGLRPRERQHVRKQGRPVVALIKEVYDGLFLAPEDFRNIARRAFTAQAGHAFGKAGAGAPERARAIRTTKRAAVVTIDAEGAARAAARVKVKARMKVSGQRIRVAHEGTWWLQKDKRSWKVIAFDVDQRRVGGRK